MPIILKKRKIKLKNKIKLNEMILFNFLVNPLYVFMFHIISDNRLVDHCRIILAKKF